MGVIQLRLAGFMFFFLLFGTWMLSAHDTLWLSKSPTIPFHSYLAALYVTVGDLLYELLNLNKHAHESRNKHLLGCINGKCAIFAS